MLRVVLMATLAALLSACADDTTTRHSGPPHDPPDYHGVPTDDRPPMVIDNLPPAQ